MGVAIIFLLIQLHTFVLSQDTIFPGFGNPNIDINSASSQNFRDTGAMSPNRNPDTMLNPSTAAGVLPTCANLMCTLEFIPDECWSTPVLVVNGARCRGCPTLSENCRNKPSDLPSPIPDVSPPPEVACPTLSCPLAAIPPGCEYIETYEYFGRKCEKCPVWRSGCTESGGQIACPLQDCPMEYILPQCQEIPTYTFMGRKCTGCPQRKKNCNPVVLGPDGTINNPEITQIGCPLIDCGGRIPPECRERNTYDINGKICEACPTWKASCKPPIENIAPSDGPRMACPLFNCPGNIPGECTEQQPYEFQGQLCYKCPKWKAGCVPTNRIGGPQKACPLMRCEPLNVPLDCLEDSFFMFEGQRCQGCPGVKQECKPLLNTKPEGGLDRVLTEAIDITTTDGCPPQRCLFIYIPPGCEERESFIYNGKTCYKCPTKRKDCGQEAVRCPPTPCPLIYIPPECEEKQPYLYQGRTCYRCPKRKEGCIANGVGVTKVPMANFNEVVNSVNDAECPPVGCPLILIPKECEQKQPFQYEGRTCYGCPKWRKGCSPGNSNTVDPELNQIACPLFGCPRMDIPKECLEEQPYDFQGKVCYMCPKWRKGCIPKNGNGIPDSGIISGQETPSVVSVDTTVPSVSCPLFKCSRIRIPPECMDEQPFDFSGKTCFKCPRWRLGCVPNNNTTHNGGGCPALVNCPPIEIPSECREETPYIFDGHTCYGCPKFREGCVPVKRIASLDVPCPLMACPSIYIPPECSVEHPYEFKGRTCYKCPTLQTPCIPNEGGIGPRIECPLLDCSDVRIPEECREVKTYKFEGRICNKCPSWKMGCSPSVPVMLTDDKQLPSLKPPIIEVSGFTDVTCPIPKCRRIRIPEECKLVQSYRFQGKTCYKCPIWRPGCHPGSSKLKPTKPTSNDKSTETGSSTPLELTPRRLLMEINMAAISCPRLRCPTIRIPVHCQQQTTYTYKGKTCIGCPTWSSRCDSRNVNMNGLLSLSFFNELLLRR